MNTSRMSYRELLARYLRSQRGKVAVLTLLLFAGIGLQLVNPQLLRTFIDTATRSGESSGTLRSLLLIAAAFIGVALLTQAASVAATYLSEQVGWNATNLLRTDLARHCLGLDMPFHQTRTPGEMIERIDGDVTALSQFFSQLVIKVAGSVLLLLGVLIVLFLEDPRVGLALTLFSLFALAVLALSRNYAVASVKAEREAHAALFGFIEERLAGLDDIRANGGGSYVMRRLYAAMREVALKGRTGIFKSTIFWMLTVGLFALGYALALGLGAYLYRTGTITIGTVFLFFQYTEMLRRPLEHIAEQLREFQRASAGLGRVRDLFALQSMIKDGTIVALPDGPLAVEFDHVTFTYSGDAPVLDDLSFRLAPGRVLGLLGRTGSGKTTLTRLLFRLYDVDKGTIRVNGVDLRDVPLAALRRRIGIVTQDVQLFGSSIRDNLTLFDSSIPDDHIVAALADLGMGPWLAAQPSGLDTELAAGNSELSAGEAQLLAFARVFLRDPDLVILDEASSRLDPATERLIEAAIDKLLAGATTGRRTCIIIAHRLATVQRADEIMLLERGVLVEHGPRAQLAAKPDSRFHALLHIGMEEVLA